MSSSSGGGNNELPDRKTTNLKVTTTRKQPVLHEFSIYSKKGKNNKSNKTIQIQFLLNRYAINSIDNNHSTSYGHGNDSSGISIVNNSITDANLFSFSDSYQSPLYEIIDVIDKNLQPGKLHPMKIGKLIHGKVTGVTEIKALGARVRLTFDSVTNANTCLSENPLKSNGLTNFIPSTLVYSLDVIRLDQLISESDFFDGLDPDHCVASFSRIIPHQANDSMRTFFNLVELKFLSPSIPDFISIYKVRIKVSPSIRSPVQCSNCLRFGHTGQYCQSKPRCLHCSEANHNLLSCPTATTTDPICFYCKGSHISSDRNCPEWIKQKKIKKIMAVENLTFPEAVQFNNNNFVSKAHTFSQVVSHDRPTPNVSSGTNAPTIIPCNLTSNSPSFLDLNYNNNLINHQKRKRKNNNNQRSSALPRLPIAISSPLTPNGNFLAYVESQNNGDSPDLLVSSAPAPLLSEVVKALSSLITNIIDYRIDR
jgi:hypothetical protein